MFLLDTNVCIRFLEGRSEPLRKKMLSVPAGKKCLCSVVVAELFFGAAKSKRKEQTLAVLLPFVHHFKSYDFELNAALHFADIRADLATQGRTIGPYDLQIAAIARANDLILVTANTSEFARVSGLAIEDWESS
jgi:tRNA(fMet)-specific endonuclease VapC